MAESVVASTDAEDIEQREDTGRGGRSARLVIALLILLLLTVCVVSSILDVFVTHTPEQIAFVRRNIGCLQCHTELIPAMSMADVHNPFMLKECTVCHTAHGYEVLKRTTVGKTLSWSRVRSFVEWLPLRLLCAATEQTSTVATAADATGAAGAFTTTSRTTGGGSYLTLPPDQLCWMCHGDLGPLRQATYQHQPFQRGNCTNCHDPHASNYSALLTADRRDICKRCHPMGTELDRPQTHAPAASWFCLDCHNPHASNWRGILVNRQRELCFRCHPTVASASLRPVQHSPFVNDNCSGCHEPHGAYYSPLLVQKQPDLCYSCHPAIRDDFLRVSHHPLGVKLECGDCHDPHAADYPMLLTATDNRFCYECHANQIGTTYEVSLHSNQLCIKCHTPHGSDFTPLLNEEMSGLCMNCHNQHDTGNNFEGWNRHPVSPRFYDVHNSKPLTCTSSCHDPHGTRYPMMLNYMPTYDGLCLWCHTKVGIAY